MGLLLRRMAACCWVRLVEGSLLRRLFRYGLTCLGLLLVCGSPGASTRGLAAATAAAPATSVPLAALREALREEVLGDAVLEPAWAPGVAMFLLLQPEGLTARGGRDAIDLELVRRQPGTAAYYLWRAMGRAVEHGLSFRQAVLVVPGDPHGQPAQASATAGLPVQVQAVWEAPGTVEGTEGEVPEPGPFDPATALNQVRVWVEGQPWQPDPALWATAADLLVLSGDRWLGRYRAFGSLGPMPDVSPLARAQRLYQAALELYPAHRAARGQLSVVEEKLQAVSLFSRAERLMEEHERPLREADRRHDELAATRHSFYLWRAAELLEQALELDRSLLGGAAALERIRRLLGDRPKLPYETAAQLEAELKAAYMQQAVELDYDQARRSGEAMRGTRVHLRGQVLRRIEGSRAMPAALVVALAAAGGAAGSSSAVMERRGPSPGALRPIVYVQLPRPAMHAMAEPSGRPFEGGGAASAGRQGTAAGRAPSGVGTRIGGEASGGDPGEGSLVGIPEGSVVDVWGELAGNFRYRDPAGRPSVVVRVAAAYVEVVGPDGQGGPPGQ